jgi:hypothetical protein
VKGVAILTMVFLHKRAEGQQARTYKPHLRVVLEGILQSGRKAAATASALTFTSKLPAGPRVYT